ncbi:SpoIIE family protein phosphatase [Yinghuangia soli]|uniref:SpoIIE family protein phosphatase n=1 Tax=Yinghuangia soli TaxID=2908204 RepID=A0AA41Q8U1_9ACTN|nr:SpoIIE family protein phosphatase [Yinghuangia soli]MCF2532866.1 SpoIIE family protein phosphatase [Yinghuangia soli]
MLDDPSSPLARAILGQMLDGTGAGVVVFDPGLRFAYVNPALARINGFPVAEHLGRTVAEVMPELDACDDVLREVLADGVPREVMASGHTRATSASERRFWHAAYHRVEQDGEVLGIIGILLEVTPAQEQQRALERAQQRLTTLDQAATRIGTTLDVDRTCRELARFLVPRLADGVTVEVVPHEPEDGTRPPAAHAVRLRRAATVSVDCLQAGIGAYGEPGPHNDYGPGTPIPGILATGRPDLVDLRPGDDPALAATTAERVPVYRAIGVRSRLIVPLTARGETVGIVVLVRVDGSPEFTPEDVVTAKDLAGRAAVAIDNAHRYTREHHIARELQQALLSRPSEPHPGIRIASRYLPAERSALVGGDWFDSIPLDDGRTLLVIGDVMGHGISAAVDMSHYATMLREEARKDPEPHRVLERMDERASRLADIRPATCLLALADARLGTYTYSGAGHLPPAYVDGSGSVELLPLTAGPPLGTGLGGYARHTAPCTTPDHTLLLYTDGLVERRDEDIDASLRRLTALGLPGHLPLDSLVDAALAALLTGDVDDDVAVIAARVRYTPPG